MSEVLVERRGRITIATLNRPDRGNAINPGLLDALTAAVTAFNKDPEQAVLIVTGAGDKAFCSGGDLGTMLDDVGGGEGLPMSYEPDIGGISHCEKPVICAINGITIGGGMEIAMCSDIRIASTNAWFGLPEAGHGFIAGVAVILLPRFVPLGVAMDMMLSGERLTAEAALRYGFVQEVVESDQLLDAAIRRAEKMLKSSQPALWGTKQSMRYWRDLQMAEHQRYYEAVIHRVLLSGDMVEGLKSFKEKRKPVFGGGWPDPFKR